MNPARDNALQKFCSSYTDFIMDVNQLAIKYNAILADSIANTLQNSKPTLTNFFSDEIQSQMRKSFDQKFRDEMKSDDFCNLLSKTMDSWFTLSEFFGINKSYQFFVDYFSSLNKIIEPLRDNVNRTEAEPIPMNGRYHLLHYKSHGNEKRIPILVVYSLINRHYILDLSPDVSIIKHFIDDGFDVYATDWETPATFDKDVTLDTYIHECVENSVNKIREITGTDKVTLFGYCWGGIFSLIYSAMHPQTVKNLILHATPLDLENPDTVIEKWALLINPDVMVEKIGNIPGYLLNFAFTMRNPLESVLKYPNYFKKYHSVEDVKQFFAIESWLYDSRPIIGHVYKEIIKKIYQNNELISGKMKVGNRAVELENLKMPVLNIVGLYDDLVPPNTSKHILEKIPSNDKELIEFPVGHVGLCISKKAHRDLWPKVTEWIKQRS